MKLSIFQNLIVGRCIEIPICFSTPFLKTVNFLDFLFASMDDKNFQKGICSYKRKNLHFFL